MKRNRITLAFLTCFLVFLFVGMYAQPVYAIKANDLGISVSKPTRSYDNKTGEFGMKITLKNQDEYLFYASAYLYNADGKCVATWDNKGEYYVVHEGEECCKNFVLNYTKYPSKSYTFVYKVKVKGYDYYFNPKTHYQEDPVFTWKWTVTSEEACGPSIKFKKATLCTLDDGSVVPRININCRNIKGQSLKMYIYDDTGDLVWEYQGKKRGSNNETAWFSWSGKTDSQQYPDGTYTVKVVSSGGLSIKKNFYLDFPYNNK